VITGSGKGTAAAVHKHVDIELHSRVYATGAPAVVLTDILTWPGNASLALHALCDTDNAPRRRLVVLMPGESASVCRVRTLGCSDRSVTDHRCCIEQL
jgi:hypothetical protein